jgi:hypothetical protein
VRPTEPTPFEHLVVVPLSRNEWRVSDAADAGALLGFIERQTNGRFEIVWMTDPMRWGYARTFDEAVTAFGDSTRFTGEIFLERAEAIRGARPTPHSDRGASGTRRTTWQHF